MSKCWSFKIKNVWKLWRLHCVHLRPLICICDHLTDWLTTDWCGRQIHYETAELKTNFNWPLVKERLRTRASDGNENCRWKLPLLKSLISWRSCVNHRWKSCHNFLLYCYLLLSLSHNSFVLCMQMSQVCRTEIEKNNKQNRLQIFIGFGN